MQYYTTLHIIVRTIGRRSILRTLDSIIKHPPTLDTVISVLDNSVDGCAAALLEGYADKLPKPVRLSYVHLPPPETHVTILNSAIGVVGSHYTHILDDDDYLVGDFYKECVSELEANPAAGAIMASTRIEHELMVDGEPRLIDTKNFMAPQYISLEQAITEPPLVASATLYRTYLHSIVGLFDPAILIGEDSDFFYRLLLEREVLTVQEILLCRTFRAGEGMDNLSVVNKKYATLWRAKIRDKYLRRSYRANPHAFAHLLLKET
jgi:hypothetical protein